MIATKRKPMFRVIALRGQAAGFFRTVKVMCLEHPDMTIGQMTAKAKRQLRKV